jgi:hypothetical protein
MVKRGGMRSWLAVTLLFACTARAEAPWRPDENELHQGKIVHGPDDTTYMLVHASPEACWRRIVDVEHWATVFSDLRSVRALGGNRFAFVAKAPSPFGDKKYTLVFAQRPSQRLDFALDKTQPADVKDVSGRWEMRVADGGAATLVVYHGKFDAGMYIPGFLRRRMNESLLGDFRGFMHKQAMTANAGK